MELQYQLFTDNNTLRSKLHDLDRTLQSKTLLVENLEEEVWKLKEKLKQAEKNTVSASQPIVSMEEHKESSQTALTSIETARNRALYRDLEDAVILVEKKEGEILHLKDNIEKLQVDNEKQSEIIDTQNNEITELNRRLNFLEVQQKEANKKIASMKDATVADPNSFVQLQRVDNSVEKEKLAFAEQTIAAMKKQLVEVAVEGNRKHSELQSKLQSYEGIVESVRLEYEEFIAISRLENETFRLAHKREYELLEQDFESYKLEQVEVKRKIIEEYQDILQSLEAQFDEYRQMQEFVFNLELSKFQDLLNSQASRYEHELLYVIQVKEKFYNDMMVAKDAKIMSLIEGADLQSVIQRSEMDMENLRKEHQKEIEFIKSHQETEQKNIITLLQRQNVSLEAKYDKLQTHSKGIELKNKDLMSVIEQKNRLLQDKDSARLETESKYKKKLDQMFSKLSETIAEKEKLRHKLIRIQLKNKGDHNNSVEGMLKRITQESHNLQFQVESMASAHEDNLYQTSLLQKSLKEKERIISFMEREIKKRTEEYHSMTKTFEHFLKLRSKQMKQPTKPPAKLQPKQDERKSLTTNSSSRTQSIRKHSHFLLRAVPEEDKTELEKGFEYLKKFKALSRAFATGDLRNVSNNGTADYTNQISKIPLYSTLNDVNEKIVKLYDRLDELPPIKEEDSLIKLYKPTERVLKEKESGPLHVIGKSSSS